MKNIYFYKDSNKKLNYCGWLFFKDLLSYNDKNLIFYKHDFFKNNLLSKKYEKIVFNYLYKKLNKFHKINYPKRYWKILTHNWVRFYVNSVLFRYDYLKKNITESKIKKFYFKFNSKSVNFPKSTCDFLESLENNDFNNRICYKIIKSFKTKKKIKINKQNSNYLIRYNLKYNLIKNTISNNIFKPILNFFLKFFLRENYPILVSTYLPKKLEYGYMTRSSSFFLWKNFFDINNHKINKLIERNNSSIRKIFFEKKNKCNLESIMINLLQDCFPSCFLEDFTLIKDYTKKKVDKKKIKYVFTSNEFALNEFFKFYLIELLIGGTKYFVGQHGSGYGSYIDQIDTIEELTSDKFFTWGWKYRHNHYPVGIFQNTDKKEYDPNNNINKILIVQPNLERQRHFYDTRLKYQNSINASIEIVKICKKINFKNIIYRFHHEDYKILQGKEKNILKFNKDVEIDYGISDIKKSIDDNTLVIFTYLSTGFLELLSLNCKCLSIFDLNKKFLHPNFYNKIKKLEKLNIVFNDNQKLSQHLENLILKRKFYFHKNKISKYQKIFLKEYGNLKNIKKKLDKIL